MDSLVDVIDKSICLGRSHRDTPATPHASVLRPPRIQSEAVNSSRLQIEMDVCKCTMYWGVHRPIYHLFIRNPRATIVVA